MRDRTERQRGQADGVVERVTDEGFVFMRLPNGLVDMRRVPLEQVPRYRKLTGRCEGDER